MFICLNNDCNKHTTGKTAKEAFDEMQEISDTAFGDLTFYETSGKVNLELKVVPVLKAPIKK